MCLSVSVSDCLSVSVSLSLSLCVSVCLCLWLFPPKLSLLHTAMYMKPLATTILQVTHTHARTHARTRAPTHARTHTHMSSVVEHQWDTLQINEQKKCTNNDKHCTSAFDEPTNKMLMITAFSLLVSVHLSSLSLTHTGIAEPTCMVRVYGQRV